MIPSEAKSGLWKVIGVCVLLTALVLAPVTSSKAQAQLIRNIPKIIEAIFGEAEELTPVARRIPKPPNLPPEVTVSETRTFVGDVVGLPVLILMDTLKKEEKAAAVLEKVRTFYAFTEEDDPYEYDFGAFE